MMRAAIAFVAVVALVGLAAGEVHRRNHVWVDTGIAPGGAAMHKVVVALKPSNVDELERVALAVSDPKSPQYGAHLTVDEVTAIVAPPAHVFAAVEGWLKANGAVRMSAVRNRDVIVAHMPIAALEAAFDVRMTVFEHPDGHFLIRTAQDLTLPVDIADHIDLIHNINDFPLPRRRTAMDAARRTDAAPVEAATPGAVSIQATMSSGGPYIMTTVIPTCMDGVVASTVPPCSAHAPAVTGFNVVLDAKLYGETVTTVEMGDCVVNSNKQTECTITQPVDYFKLYNVTVNAVFGSKSGPTTEWTLPVVSTAPVTPQTLAALYNIPPNVYATNGSQAVGEFEQQYYSPSDLSMFFKDLGITGANTPVTVVGFNNASHPGGEANLDIQYIMGVARGVPTTLWSIYANSTVEIDDILKWGYQVGNVTNPPLVNSLSYGMTAFHVDRYLGAGYLRRSDVEFMKLATRGITIIIADGDTGAGDLGAPPMSSPTCKVLHPDWPSQSPYVTAIASTIITPAAQPLCYVPFADGGIDCLEQPMREVTVNMDYGLFWTSGGGFSNVSPRPTFQDSVVKAYLAKTDLLPPSYMFNSTGRAYPDAVAVGHNLEVVLNGKFTPIDGTSASAPIFAGVISLINSDIISHGLSPLGWLNPFLYQAAATDASSFNDITVGNNRCGGQGFAPLCCEHGYGAGVGWDAASGLGSPNYPVLLQQARDFGVAAKAARAAAN